jgi:hypothetical protein
MAAIFCPPATLGRDGPQADSGVKNPADNGEILMGGPWIVAWDRYAPLDHAAPLAEGLHDLRSLELVQKEAEEDAMDAVFAKPRDLRGMAYVGNVGSNDVLYLR